MIVECSQCHTKYNVDDNKIPPLGVKVRCRQCQNIISIKKEEPKPTPPPIVPEKAAESVSRPPPSEPRPVTQPVPEAPIPAAEPTPTEVSKPSAQAPSTEMPKQALSPPSPGITGPAPQPPPTEFQKPAAPPPPVDQPVVMPTQPRPEIPKPPEPELPAGAERQVIEMPKPPPPGLSEEDNKWHERARRLAKALASDLVLYNREKVEEGLREGSLAGLLGSEIRRSWEYYCQQIPKHIIESSDYFKEQLNRIVGKGKQIFR